MNLEMNRPRERSLVETKLDQAQSKKSVTHTENYQKAMNLLNGLGPNKENEITTFNLSRRQLLKPGRDLKELDIKSVDRRSLSLLDGLRSNKAQESEGKNCQYFSNSSSSNDETSSSQSQNVSKELLGASVSNQQVIFTGISKDNKYKIVSKCYQGEELNEIAEQQHAMQLRGRKAAEKFKVNTNLPPVEPSKTATKENGLIKSYAVNTHQGISRNYNEDRVSVTLNITKNEIKSHFFAVYDGHGGTRCCDFLKDHLHELIINNEHFPSDPKKAIGDSIIECENLFVEYGQKKYEQTGKVEKSGSCAIVVMTIGLECYVANVGDSRAIVSTEGGKFAYNLNRDHKPTDKREQVRILSLGGKIYRTEMTKIQDNTINEPPLIGPLRVFPGKLSVTRTIGDIEAKSKQFGGIPECISIIPEIRKFKLTSKEDFILLCCDGIVEKMESVDIVRHVWKVLKEYKQDNLHEACGKCVDSLILEAMQRQSNDNLTVIMICLSDLLLRSGAKTDNKSLASNYASV